MNANTTTTTTLTIGQDVSVRTVGRTPDGRVDWVWEDYVVVSITPVNDRGTILDIGCRNADGVPKVVTIGCRGGGMKGNIEPR